MFSKLNSMKIMVHHFMTCEYLCMCSDAVVFSCPWLMVEKTISRIRMPVFNSAG